MGHTEPDDLEVFEVCEPTEPGVDTWLYTPWVDGGLGPALLIGTGPAQGDGLLVGTWQLEQCLRQWATERAQGRSAGRVVLHGGLVTIEPVGARLTDPERWFEETGNRLCLLDDDVQVEVIAWTVQFDRGRLPEGRVRHDSLDDRICSALGVVAHTQLPTAAHRLIEAIDPDADDLGVATGMARIGALGAMQQAWRIGASGQLCLLRSLAASGRRDLTGLARMARHLGRRWARKLWPPDHDGFDRRWHRPSVALVHHVEAACLALALYPRIPSEVFHAATLTTLHLLSDGRWRLDSRQSPPVTGLIEELEVLPRVAWEAYAAAEERSVTDDVGYQVALARCLGTGMRAPTHHDLVVAVPTWFDEATRRRLARTAAELGTCRLAGVDRSDLLTAILAGRSIDEA